MSKYTTGEAAKECGVSVRTVQYYDTRGILVPSELTEGGRRLYSDEDIRRLKVICFLRELDIPINSIGELLSEETSEETISLLLDEQERRLRSELDEGKKRLEKITALRRSLKMAQSPSLETIGDIAHMMENRKKLRKARIIVTIIGLIMDAVEIGTLVLWILRGIWQPFAVGMCAVIACGVCIFCWYHSKISYICPECHTVFEPGVKEMLFAHHTPNTRRLTCPSCDRRSFCVETYREEK